MKIKAVDFLQQAAVGDDILRQAFKCQIDGCASGLMACAIMHDPVNGETLRVCPVHRFETTLRGLEQVGSIEL